jgi:hypothetical protein
VKPSEITVALTHLTKQQRPAFIWGPPGVGKSDVMHQIAADLGYELRDMRLSTMDPTMLQGFPIPDMEAKVMKWLVAEVLPPMTVKKGAKMVPNDSKGVLFLDEMNSAAPAVQAAGYQLILNRRLGEYILPKNWSVHAAGNRASDRSIVHAMPAALANRFVHIDFSVDVDDWLLWAAQNGVSEVTRGFIKFRPGLLHSFDAASNPRAFPSPRSWRFVDDIVHQGLPTSIERSLIEGTVGNGAMVEYVQFASVYKDLPTVEEIMLNPDTAPVPDDSNPAAQYAVCTMLDSRAGKSNMGRLHTYIARMRTEFQVFFMRSAARINRDITQTKEFQSWITKHQDILI